MAEAQARGCLTFVGHCYETDGSPPFIPFIEILERSAQIVPRAALRDALGDAASEVAGLVPELRQMFPDIPPAIELPLNSSGATSSTLIRRSPFGLSVTSG